MASGLCSVIVLVLCAFLAPCMCDRDNVCNAYTDSSSTYHPSEMCLRGFCCGSCYHRYCCQDTFWRFPEDEQEDCVNIFSRYSSPAPMIIGITGFIIFLLIVICCCVCPCCCLYKMCRKPQPVVATTTLVTNLPQQYPQQPTVTPGQPQQYQGAQYPPYQPVPVQPGYGSQPVPQVYGPQPMPAGPYQGQPFTAGPPPTYQEATSPAYPPNPMLYSQAAFSPGQPSYPLQPPAQPQANAPPAQPDYLGQPAYNPDYFTPPPKTG
ncbi:protein shisa-4-like [Aulostomus maculatus]